MRDHFYRLLDAGRWQDALAVLDGMATSGSDSPSSAVARGLTLRRLGHRPAAIREYLQGLAFDPENRNVLDAALSLALEEGDRALIKRLLGHILTGQFADASQVVLAGLQRITPPFGYVQLTDGVASGWAVGQGKVIQIEFGGQRTELLADQPTPHLLAAGIGDGANGFSVKVANAPEAIRFGIEGVSLWGSPVADRTAPPARVAPPPASSPIPQPPLVVVPVFGGETSLRRCLDSLAQSTGLSGTRVWVIEDCPDDDAVKNAARELCQRHGFHLLSRSFNAGFSATVNAALRVMPAGDVILLNSDTIVCGDWMTRLQSVAYAANDVATVTPLSNNGELLSHPVPCRATPFGNAALVSALDRACGKARFKPVEIPVGVGFCLFIRADARQAAGGLDEITFGRGYAEETDYCLRLSEAGWRHMAAPQVFVGHEGGHSFGAERALLAARNTRTIYARYPAHSDAYTQWVASDPLAEVRSEIQRAVAPAVLASAGVEEVLLGARDDVVCVLKRLVASDAADMPITADDSAIPAAYATCYADKVRLHGVNLPLLDHVDYPHPSKKKTLFTALSAAKASRIVVRSLATPVLHLLESMPATCELVFHLDDASGYCPRGSATRERGRRCDTDQTAGDCDACVARLGSASEVLKGTAAWRKRVDHQLSRAARILVNDAELGRRYQAHFPARPIAMPDTSVAWMSPANLISRFGKDACFAVVGANSVSDGFANLHALLLESFRMAPGVRYVLMDHHLARERVASCENAAFVSSHGERPLVQLLRQHRCCALLVPSLAPGADQRWIPVAGALGLPLLKVVSGALS